jgi:hypothetical protein
MLARANSRSMSLSRPWFTTEDRRRTSVFCRTSLQIDRRPTTCPATRTRQAFENRQFLLLYAYYLFFTFFAQNSPRGLFVVIFILLCCLLYRFLFYLFIFNLFFVIEPRASLSVYRRYPISYFLRFVSPTFLKMSWWIFSVVPIRNGKRSDFLFVFYFSSTLVRWL